MISNDTVINNIRVGIPIKCRRLIYRVPASRKSARDYSKRFIIFTFYTFVYNTSAPHRGGSRPRYEY